MRPFQEMRADHPAPISSLSSSRADILLIGRIETGEKTKITLLLPLSKEVEVR